MALLKAFKSQASASVAEGEIQVKTPLNSESYTLNSLTTFRVKQRFNRIFPAAPLPARFFRVPPFFSRNLVV